MNSTNTSVCQDDKSDVLSLLASLSDGSLAQRIANAARVAAAQHMLLQAQAMQASAEAENSAQ
ncbi:MAG: hypothetical protein K9M57_02430 [Phycisphaerae bacterium]|nr:hypothetical protein [Phycisphaerae bacterium]